MWNRLLKQLKRKLDIPVSIDTYKSEIARRALDLGVDIVNDISGLTFDPEMAAVVCEAGCPVVIMHIQGTPTHMQKNPHYNHLMEELYQYFQERLQFCKEQGIEQIILDPGIGFGKRLPDNFEIIRRLPEFKGFGYPLLVGPSRKSFIGKVLKVDTEDRLLGTAATVAVSLMKNVNLIRVHDIAEMQQINQIIQAIRSKNFLLRND